MNCLGSENIPASGVEANEGLCELMGLSSADHQRWQPRGVQ